MERIATNGNQVPGVEESDVRIAREHAVKDITKLYLMSYYWTILAMTTVGNLPHPNTKFQYVYVIFQLLGKSLKLQICDLKNFSTTRDYEVSNRIKASWP